MRSQPVFSWAVLGLGYLATRAVASDVLKTNGFTDCSTNGTIKVTKMDIQYDRTAEQVVFNVAGTSTEAQNVTATLVVSAYGKEVYSKSFDPCEAGNYVQQLCPVPSGSFAASGSESIPSQYASMIPAIAFSVPDLDGLAKLELKAKDSGNELACIESNVNNGKSVDVPAVSYIAAGIAGAAFAMSAVSALASAGHPGATSSSPTFTELVWWFQSMAMNGMHSVDYPTVYRQFSKNFAFSTGVIPWASMQRSIDSFRAATGGNLTRESYEYLQNTTLVFADGTNTTVSKRALTSTIHNSLLFVRGLETSFSSDASSNSSSSSSGTTQEVVRDAKAYFEELSVPSANVFMTVLLVFAIVIAALVCGVLLLKVILEAWSLTGSFPKKLTSFRKNYWFILARTVTSLIMLLYGVWVLYCIYQFVNGDSWAAKLLAALTLCTFTGVLIFYGFRIWTVVQASKKLEGDDAKLYNDKSTWTKYRIFYENFRTGYWWFFIPAIVYMFAKGCVLAAGDGHGLVQTAGQLIIESLMLICVLWSRPYNTTSGKWINITVQAIRVLSVVCILVFVEELGISQTTKTVTGVVLIAVQSGLTGLLAILIGINAIITCVRENPHRKRRKEAEKLNRDNLTPLDARDSLLMEPAAYKKSAAEVAEFNAAPSPYEPFRSGTQKSRGRGRDESEQSLMSSAAEMGQLPRGRSLSHGSDGSVPPPTARPGFRQPTLPRVGYSVGEAR